MTQATVSRRRPCRACGGRYFVTTMSVFAALLAIAVALAGMAKAILGSGILDAVAGGAIPDPGSLVADGVWAVGGIVLAGIISFAGRGHRCIRCDTQQ
jgi:hypothetical protein